MRNQYEADHVKNGRVDLRWVSCYNRRQSTHPSAGEKKDA